MIEVLKQALEALESCGEGHITDGGNQWHDAKLVDTAITSLRQAIKELESQEPVAINWNAIYEKLELVWYRELSADEGLDEIQDLIDTHPPQRTEEKNA